MRPVHFFVRIQIKPGISSLQSQEAADILIHLVFAPKFLRVEITEPVNSVHLKESDGIRNLAALSRL